MSSSIAEISAEPIEREFVRPFRNAKVRMTTVRYVRVAVSAGGKTGRGEMMAMPGYAAETIASMLEAIGAHFGPAVKGLDALDGNRIDEALRGALPGNPYARSVLELALWEVRAKLLGVPVHALLGGTMRDTVPIGVLVTLDTPEEMAKDAAHWRSLGAGTYQVKIAHDAKSSAARVRAVREAVGKDAVIAVDGNGSFTANEAMRTLDAIAPFGVDLFEQPVAVWDYAGMAALVRRNIMPIVADECLVTAQDALRLVREGAANAFNLKIAKSGISETQRIIAIAESAGLGYGLGTMLETRFGTLAGIHLAATLRNPMFSAELVGPWKVRDGDVPAQDLASDAFAWRVPTAEGWGRDP